MRSGMTLGLGFSPEPSFDAIPVVCSKMHLYGPCELVIVLSSGMSCDSMYLYICMLPLGGCGNTNVMMT